MVAQIFRFRDHSSLCSWSTHSSRQSADRSLVQRLSHFDSLEIKRSYLLRFSIFKNREVALLQAPHKFSGLRIANHDISQNKLGIGLENIVVLLRSACIL